MIMEETSGAGETDIIGPGETTVKDIFIKRCTIVTMIMRSITAGRIEMKGRK